MSTREDDDLEDDDEEDDSSSSGGEAGCAVVLYTPGMILAMIISWEMYHSIFWAIIHGYCSWAYVIYYAMRK